MSDGLDVTTLVLPESGWLLQWRSDGYWRELSPEQHRAEIDGSHVPWASEWAAWTGLPNPHGRAKWAPGMGKPPHWWFVYGELPDDSPVRVVLADGREPEVRTVGRLWAAEWVGLGQRVSITVGDLQPVELRWDRRPGYL